MSISAKPLDNQPRVSRREAPHLAAFSAEKTVLQVPSDAPLGGWTDSEMPSVCLRLWPAVVAAYHVAAFSSAIFFSAFPFPIRQSLARRPLCGLGQRFSTRISQPRPCSRSSSLDALRATLLHANWFLQGTANRSPRSHPKCHDGSLYLMPVCRARSRPFAFISFVLTLPAIVSRANTRVTVGLAT